MDSRTLQDRIDRGLGAAARHVGAPCDAYRPADPLRPLAPQARYLRLHATFTTEDHGLRRPVAYGRATWSGIFDTAYTRPGDIIAGPGGIYFIAAQQPLLPALCVLTTRTVTVTRSAAPATAGVNGYGGLLAATATTTLAGWPASILFAGAGSPGDLPGESSTPVWTILLPATPVPLAGADLVTDDRGVSYVVGSAELTALGWRILAKQATP